MNRYLLAALISFFACAVQANGLLGYWQNTADPNAWIEYRDGQVLEWVDGRRMSASAIVIEATGDTKVELYLVRSRDEPSMNGRLSIQDRADWQLERRIGDATSQLRRIYSEVDLHSGATISLRQVQPWQSGACNTVMMGFDYRASSTLAPSTRSNYAPTRMLDGRSDTAWVEAASGAGVGEVLTLDLSDLRQQMVIPDAGESTALESVEAVVLEGLQIVNGYPKSQRLYKANGRVAEIHLELDGVALGSWEIADTDKAQALALEPPLLLTRDARLRLRITAVYPGERYADTAIAELLPVVHGCAQILAID